MTTLQRHSAAIIERLHWLLIPLALFAGAQLLQAFFLLQASTEQLPLPAYEGWGADEPVRSEPIGPDSRYDLKVSSWDGQWYRRIAEQGYPDQLPRLADGTVDANSWAFYPAYPTLVRTAMAVTGLPFGWAGWFVSVGFALAGLVLLYRWVHACTSSKWASTLAVGSVLAMPAALVFQLTYTEGLSLFLLVLFLRAVSERRFLHAVPLVLALGLTRNIVIPLLGVLVVVGFAAMLPYLKRGPAYVRIGAKVNRRTIREYLMLGFITGLSGALWPAIAGLCTGEPLAYFKSFEGWFTKSPYLTWFTVSPFEKWDNYLLGTVPVVVLVTLVALMLALFKESGYPLALRVFPLCLALYIFICTPPLGSEFRYLTMGFFLFPFTKVPTRTDHRVLYFGGLALLALCAGALQWHWVSGYWVMTLNGLVVAP